MEPCPAELVENGPASGASAVKLGYMAIASGMADVVLVAAGELMRTVSGWEATNIVATMSHIEAEYNMGLTLPGFAGMFTRLYMQRYGMTERDQQYVMFLFLFFEVSVTYCLGFGTMNDKPVFVLPGSPASNLMAFLQIALPGLGALSGRKEPGLKRVNARLGSEIEGKEVDWTDFFYGRLEHGEGLPVLHPLDTKAA